MSRKENTMCGRRTLEDADGSGEVVDSPGSAESGGEDGGGGDEIVGEGVVQVALWFGKVRVSGRSRRRDGTIGGRQKESSDRHTWSSKTSWTPSNSFS